MQIDMKQPILDKNDKLAKSNRELFAEKKVFVLDLLASPGSGKTSTILATIEALRDEFNIAVIEGDIASSVDSEKIKAQGIAAVQINTGGACHLESDMIRRAVDVLDLCERGIHLRLDFFVDAAAVLVVLRAGFGGDGEALRDRHSEVGHFCEVGALAAKQLTHGAVALGEKVNILH